MRSDGLVYAVHPVQQRALQVPSRERREGDVVEFWQNLSDAFLSNLRDLAATKGLAGCFEYWCRSLTEEAADFRMTLDGQAGTFQTHMRRFPSVGRWLQDKHLIPYPNYCEHRDTLWRRVLEPLGFLYGNSLDRVVTSRAATVV